MQALNQLLLSNKKYPKRYLVSFVGVVFTSSEVAFTCIYIYIYTCICIYIYIWRIWGCLLQCPSHCLQLFFLKHVCSGYSLPHTLPRNKGYILKTNMAPKHHPFEKENHLPTLDSFLGKFSRCSCCCHVAITNIEPCRDGLSAQVCRSWRRSQIQGVFKKSCV